MLRRRIRLVWSSHGSYFGEAQSGQNTHGIPPKRIKKVRLGIVTVPKFSPRSGNIVRYQVSDLIS